MSKYARIENNLVIETFIEPSGFTIDECFHPDVRQLFVEVPDEVEQNWIIQGGKYFPPVIESI